MCVCVCAREYVCSGKRERERERERVLSEGEMDVQQESIDVILRLEGLDETFSFLFCLHSVFLSSSFLEQFLVHFFFLF